jgi:hypothetical protein
MRCTSECTSAANGARSLSSCGAHGQRGRGGRDCGPGAVRRYALDACTSLRCWPRLQAAPGAAEGRFADERAQGSAGRQQGRLVVFYGYAGHSQTLLLPPPLAHLRLSVSKGPGPPPAVHPRRVHAAVLQLRGLRGGGGEHVTGGHTCSCLRRGSSAARSRRQYNRTKVGHSGHRQPTEGPASP